MSGTEAGVTAQRIRGRSDAIEAKVWQAWFDEVAGLVERFHHEEADDPFAYNETASVSLLCSAASRMGGLALAEFNSTKKGTWDARTRSNGRADFWMRVKERTWSFEFKQLTYGPVTSARLRQRMNDADECAGKIIRYGVEHMISGLIVPLYYLEDEQRPKALERLETFRSECDFAWSIMLPGSGAQTFFFFRRISRPA